MRRPDCLVSGTTTNEAVTLVSLQNGNSFSSPQREADSLATGVHCNRVEALWILWERKQDDWRDLRDLLFSVFFTNRGRSIAFPKLSRSKCKSLHSRNIKYFVSLKNTRHLLKKPCYLLNECSFRGTELIDRIFICKCSHRWRQNQSCMEKTLKIAVIKSNQQSL